MLNFDACVKKSDAAQPRVTNVKTPIPWALGLKATRVRFLAAQVTLRRSTDKAKWDLMGGGDNPKKKYAFFARLLEVPREKPGGPDLHHALRIGTLDPLLGWGHIALNTPPGHSPFISPEEETPTNERQGLKRNGLSAYLRKTKPRASQTEKLSSFMKETSLCSSPFLSENNGHGTEITMLLQFKGFSW